jgi:leucyl aminopeptidase
VPSDSAGLPPQVSPPQFALSTQLPDAIGGVEVLVFPALPGPDGSTLLGPGADEASESLGLDFLELLDALSGKEAPSKPGQVTTLPVAGHASVRRVLLVGVGDQSPSAFRRAGAAVARAARDIDAVASSVAAISDGDGFEAFVVGAMLGAFGFHWRSTGPEHLPVARIVLAGHADAAERDGALRRAIAIGGAAWRSRTLATVPSNLKNPAWLAEQAREVAADSGLEVSVWDEKQLAKRGMGGILAVGQASATPPRLIRLDYTPANGGRRAPRVVLVGKGITFDTGGLSIKTAEGMSTMKRDMTGGGVVISVLGALAAVGCPVRVTGLVAAAENAVGADSVRPGDIVRHYGGRTSEVNNTDAEGRLVLADALAYAVDELKPDVLVDVATLTGAIRVALGSSIAAVYATDDTLADRLVDAGRRAGEPAWRMPLASVYDDKLTSKIADADNAPGGPGSITAALFLQGFVGKVPWAHFDLASVGDASADSFEWSKGPTGWGARALLAWLGSPDPVKGIR